MRKGEATDGLIYQLWQLHHHWGMVLSLRVCPSNEWRALHVAMVVAVQRSAARSTVSNAASPIMAGVWREEGSQLH